MHNLTAILFHFHIFSETLNLLYIEKSASHPFFSIFLVANRGSRRKIVARSRTKEDMKSLILP